IDYPHDARGGASLQHITPLPGATGVAYNTYGSNGVIELRDSEPHSLLIEVKDANGNTTRIPFRVQYDASLTKEWPVVSGERFIPNQVNIFERESLQSLEAGGFQLVTSDKTVYDTTNLTFAVMPTAATNAVSPQFIFLTPMIPFHDSVTVRIKPSVVISDEDHNRILIKSVSGTKTVVQKAVWQKGWLMAKFRQAGSFQAFIDNIPPTVNSIAADLSRAKRIVFTPTDNFSVIKSFRVELDGQWLRFTNDKGKTWIYTFDEKFPPGEHELSVRVEDEAGNATEKIWKVKR
ncbi:MAG TPA: Ig-like domain-containing protein, partial [Flavisolibacter sp.]|nr:Ig-like domain-containing protein [Flavisolibacter sp.]